MKRLEDESDPMPPHLDQFLFGERRHLAAQ
jgi:hypothetical protein